MTDRFGEPWSGTHVNGFSGSAPKRPHRPDEGLRIERPEARQFEPHEYRRERAQRHSLPKGLILGGVAGAVALGLGLGFLARPDFGDDGRAREPMAPAATVAEATLPPAASVPVEVAPALPPAPAAAQAPSRPMEVLPQEMARSANARAAATTVVARPAPPPPAAVAAAAPTPRIAAAPVEAQAPPAAPASARAPVETEPAPTLPGFTATARPSFNCRYAETRSERMVCGDAQLARLDRRLNRAFQQAVSSGVPFRELRADQDDWLRIREDAAQRAGPDGVASVYRQRIAELQEMAEAP